uniref:Outer capsid protein VP5 n=1 Tax=Palyam virus TaxID=40059 RepID=A0A4P9JF75_9REOV|nr:VP5 [Palyam virus]QCU80127.1 VP5 [Palyam virus]QCU80128.1 VP5 [Palyam virus]
MGRFVKFLKRAGKTTMNALTSNTAKSIYKTVGKTIQKVAESELGSAAIDGIIQGAARSALEGENLGESIKQAVILNMMGASNAPPDPISPGEHAIYNRLAELEKEEQEDRFFDQNEKEIIDEYGEELRSIRQFGKGMITLEESGMNEMEMIRKSIKGMEKIEQKHTNDLQTLRRGLTKEASMRNQREQELISYFNNNMRVLQDAISIEQEGLHEEAVQEILDMGAEVLETAAEEVPVLGAGAANAIASVRAVEGALKLKEVIQKLSGVDLSHMTYKSLQPDKMSLLLRRNADGDVIQEKDLLEVVDNKLALVREIGDERKHLLENIVPKIEKMYDKHQKPMKVHAAMKINKEFHPKIHIYTAPWDSDYVFMFKCVAPHHKERGFFLGFDLELDFVYFEDLKVEAHQLVEGAIEVVGRSFRQIYRDFFYFAWNVSGASEIHKKRLQRSSSAHPIYLGSVDYQISYDQLYSHANQLVTNEELQLHVLRGPLHFQRRTIMAALLHGVEIMTRPNFLTNDAQSSD